MRPMLCRKELQLHCPNLPGEGEGEGEARPDNVAEEKAEEAEEKKKKKEKEILQVRMHDQSTICFLPSGLCWPNSAHRKKCVPAP